MCDEDGIDVGITLGGGSSARGRGRFNQAGQYRPEGPHAGIVAHVVCWGFLAWMIWGLL